MSADIPSRCLPRHDSGQSSLVPQSRPPSVQARPEAYGPCRSLHWLASQASLLPHLEGPAAPVPGPPGRPSSHLHIQATPCLSVPFVDLRGDGTVATQLTDNDQDDWSPDVNDAGWVVWARLVCPDTDGDGYGDPASYGCPYPQPDCDDGNPDVNPGATEGPFGDPTCGDLLDNDCDGAVDELDPPCALCVDSDGDGYGNPASTACPHAELDCDDSDPDVNPGMSEIRGNGVDDDCDPDTLDEPLTWALVDVAGDVASGSTSVSLAVTSTGGLRIAYVNAARELKYALCDTGCTDPTGWTIVQLPASPSGTSGITLDLGPADEPQVFYDGAFYIAAAGDGSDPADWSTPLDLGEYLTAPSGSFLFALSPDGKPRISAFGEGGLRFGGCDENCSEGSNWACDPNDYSPPGIGDYVVSPSAMTVASSPSGGDAPRILWSLFGSMGRTGTYYLGCDAGCENGANWFASLFPDRWPFSLAAASDGLARFTTFEPWGDGAGYTACLDSACEEAVGSALENGPGPLALTASDQPRIVLEIEGGGVAYASCDGDGCVDLGAWSIQEVFAGADVCCPDLVLDGEDLPRIAFQHGALLRVAIAAPAPEPAWGAASVIGMEEELPSEVSNPLLVLFAPLGALLIFKGLRRGRAS